MSPNYFKSEADFLLSKTCLERCEGREIGKNIFKKEYELLQSGKCDRGNRQWDVCSREHKRLKNKPEFSRFKASDSQAVTNDMYRLVTHTRYMCSYPLLDRTETELKSRSGNCNADFGEKNRDQFNIWGHGVYRAGIALHPDHSFPNVHQTLRHVIVCISTTICYPSP